MKSNTWPVVGGAVLLLALYGVPALWLVVTSFKSDGDIINNVASLIFVPTLDAYASILDPALATAMLNALIIATLSTAIVMVVAVPAAYALAHLQSGRGLVIGLLIALQTIPVASFVIPMFSVLKTWNLLGTLPGVAVAISAMSTPYTVLLLRPFFLSVPFAIEEAAELDGANRLRGFFSVVLPNVRNGVLTLAILNFIHAWGEFTYSISLLSDNDLYPISALLSQQVSLYGVNWNRLMALAVMAALPMVLLFSLVARRFTSGLALGYGK